MPVVFANVAVNTRMLLEHLGALAREDVDLAIFPECVLTGYCFDDRQAALETALEMNSTAITELVASCRDLRIAAVFGFLEGA